MLKFTKKHSGFTIVELLIVVVVIAILAAISVVAYTGIQARARDSIRKSDLAAIAKALEVRTVDLGYMLGSGSSCSTPLRVSGWFSQAGVGLTGLDYGTYSAAECSANASNTSVIHTDPTVATSCVTGSPASCYAYLFCSTSTETYVFAHLETVATSGTSVDGAACQPGYDTSWGVNYYVRASRN